MAGDLAETNESTSSSDNNSSADGGGANNNSSTETIQEDAAPINAGTNTATTEGAPKGGEHVEGQARELGKEQKEQEESTEKTPFDIVKEAIVNFAASFPLGPKSLAEVRNGLTGFAMSGIQLTEDMVKNTVKAVDPLAHAVGEAVKNGQFPSLQMKHIDNYHSGQLATQSGKSQEHSAQLSLLS